MKRTEHPSRAQVTAALDAYRTEEETMKKPTDSTALATRESVSIAKSGIPKGMEGAFSEEAWAALTTDEQRSAIAFFQEEEQESRTISLDKSLFRIKLPGSGGREFEIPSPDGGEPELVKEIEAIIIWAQPIRDYYPSEQPQGKPPACASPDRIMPYDVPTKQATACAVCPHNQWGSGRNGQGKACKEKYRLFLRRTGSDVPMMMTLPTMGAKEFETYVTGLRLQKRVPSGVRSSFMITKAENSEHTTYPLVKARVASPNVSIEEMRQTAQLREAAKRIASEFGIRLSEATEEDHSTAPAPPANGGHIIDVKADPVTANASDKGPGF